MIGENEQFMYVGVSMYIVKEVPTDPGAPANEDGVEKKRVGN